MKRNEQQKKVHREQMKKYRKQQRKKTLLGRGKCPVCTMILCADNEYDHRSCPYYKDTHAFL